MPKPKSITKTKLKSIPGALSIYRVGDEVEFTMEGVQMWGTIIETRTKQGQLEIVANIESELIIPAARIDKVNRAA